MLKKLSLITLIFATGGLIHATDLSYEIVKKQNSLENIELSYPKFTEDWLNEMIEKPMLLDYNERISSEMGQDDQFYFSLESDVIGKIDSIVTVRETKQEMLDGASAHIVTNLRNIDLNTKKDVTFNDLFASESARKALAEVGEKYFEEAYKDEVKEDLIKFEGDFVLGEEYGFTDEGLIFIYGANTIGPAYLGEVQFTIPYSELLNIIPEDSKLYPLIKK